MLESAIQTKIKKYLEREGWMVVKCIQMSLNGWPDLQAHKDGTTIFIECKQPGKKATPLQLFRHEQLRKKGFEVISEATSLKDIYERVNTGSKKVS
jgi:Holliday junction resolvase